MHWHVRVRVLDGSAVVSRYRYWLGCRSRHRFPHVCGRRRRTSDRGLLADGVVGTPRLDQTRGCCPVIIGCCIVLTLLARHLDLLSLGDRQARHLGLDVARTRKIIIAMTALLTGTSVAFTGTIGFIGLVVPHLARLLCGPSHRRVLPVSAVLGALLIVFADTLSRTIAPPDEVPIGLFTAALGAPFFLIVVLRTKEAHS